MLNEMASGGKLTTYLMDQNLLTDVAGFKPEECQDAHDFLMRLLKSLELCYKSKIYEASGAHLSPSIADLQIGPLEYLKNLSIEVTYTCGHCGTKKNDVFKKLAMRKTKICKLEDKIQLEDQEESILLDIMSQGVDELESKWLKIVQGAKINYVKQVPTTAFSRAEMCFYRSVLAFKGLGNQMNFSSPVPVGSSMQQKNFQWNNHPWHVLLQQEEIPS